MTCALYDVRDVEGFVKATLGKWRIALSPHEREELVAEGMAIMCELAAKFEPHREGYEREGSFAGYATSLLSRKLSDAWHRMNSHHVLHAQADGKRRWHYYMWAKSLTELLEEETSYMQDTDHDLDEERIRTVGNFIAPPLAEAWATRHS